MMRTIITLFLCLFACCSTSLLYTIDPQTDLRRYEQGDDRRSTLQSNENHHHDSQQRAPRPKDQNIISNTGRPANCLELQFMGYTSSGVYTIYPRPGYSILPFDVYCDMKTDGGGWTMFQRRGDYRSHTNFTRPWNDYKSGFGELLAEFWLGNDYLHLLTEEDDVELRFDLEDFDGKATYATYGQFAVGAANVDYRMTVGQYSGETATVPGDSFSYHNGAKFSTYDKNNVGSCSSFFLGGWWFVNCFQTYLNGLYYNYPGVLLGQGIEWNTWRGQQYSLKKTEMKIRPKRSR